MALSASSNPSALPIATEISFELSSFDKLSTLNEGSYPGALESKMGYLDLPDATTLLKSNAFYSEH